MNRDFLDSIRTPVIILAFLLLGTGIVTYQAAKTPSSFRQQAISPQPSPTATTTSPVFRLAESDSEATLVYGVWEEGKSIIKTINVDGSNHITLAKLPSNIKDVNAVSENELLYIAETDGRDHGKKVDLYNLTTSETKTLFSADPGFGIDDIVLSSDKQHLAVWEVKFAPNSNILEGGNSRVYIVKSVNPGNKTLIVDEENVSSTNPLRYPLFFDSAGRLYLDTFGPNGGGWNLGLWVVNNDGTNLVPVPGMADGEYSIDPVTSLDGTKIVFTGYDPSAFPQLQTATSGVLRPAIANPNLLQIMDLSNFQKTTLLGSADGAQYANPIFSDDQQKIAFLKYQVLDGETSKYQGIEVYDLASGEITRISSPELTLPVVIFKFSQNGIYWGKEAQDIGNLGNNYQSAFETFSLTKLEGTTSLVVVGYRLQFIDCLNKAPGQPLAFNISTQTVPEPTAFSLKLKSFEFKPLVQIRTPQQNDSPDLPHCHDLLGNDRRSEWAAARREGKCSDSPLYLYPQKETWVTVRVKPPAEILYSEPTYNSGWQVLAKPSGQLITTERKKLNKISYTYLTSQTEAPKSGLVVKKEELETTLETYAKNLGLEGREITDFVLFWKQNLPVSAYYFISHFNTEESKTLLPIEITPKPEILIQVVMYFKPLEKPINVAPPVFEEIHKRSGFVAVDWSGMIYFSTP